MGELDGGKRLKVSISNQKLYELLEGHFSQAIQGKEHKGELLRANLDRFELLLHFYKGPSSSSKSTIQNLPTITLQNEETVKISKEVCKFILSASETLQLDELQTLDLFQNYVTKNPMKLDRLPDVSDLLHYYNEERIYLLECVVSLLRSCANEMLDSAVPDTVDQLYRSNFVITSIELYKELVETKMPQMSQNQSMIWANQIVAEEAAMMRIFFYIFFEDRFEPKELYTVAQLLQNHEFGSKQPHHALLDDTGRENIKMMKYLSGFILVEGLQLENLYSDEYPHPMQRENGEIIALQLHNAFMEWSTHPSIYHGPVLLAWSIACQKLSENEALVELKVCDPILAAAITCTPFSFLKQMLSDPVLCNDEENQIAFKSVLRGLVLALFTAFSATDLLENDRELLLIDLYCELFNNEPEICRLFWEEDIQSPSRRILLDITKSQFPHSLVPFVKILTALAGDKEYAQNVFQYLESLDSFTVIGEREFQKFVAEEPSTGHLRSQQNFLCQGVLITYGATAESQGEIVTWRQMTYSAFSHFHFRLSQFSSYLSNGGDFMANASHDIIAILQLVHTLVSKDFSLALQLASATPSHAPSWIHLFLQIITHLTFHSSISPESSQILSLTLFCLVDFSHTHAAELWAHTHVTGTTGSIGVTENNVSLLLQCMRSLLHHYELPTGNFCMTLPFLRLLHVLLVYLQRWNGSISSMKDSFTPYLEYIRLHILVSFNSWRYLQPSDRSKIGLHLMEILLTILTDTEEGAPALEKKMEISGENLAGSMKQSLLQWLLYDSSFHNVILNIVSGGKSTLSELRARRSSLHEVRTLEDMILSAFDILIHVLTATSQISGESSLEHALMSYFGRKNTNFVSVISSFISYPYHYKVPLMSIRVLRFLCTLSLQSEFSHKRPSLVAYLGSDARLICSQLMQILHGNHEQNEELHIEVLELVSTALQFQLGLAEMLLQLDKDKMAEDKHGGPITEILSLLSSPEYPTKQPKLYAAALSLLHAIWDKTPDHHVIRTLRENETFWQNLIKPLSAYKSVHRTPKKSEKLSTEHICYQYTMSSRIFRILAIELYYSENAVERLEKFIGLKLFISENILEVSNSFSSRSWNSVLIESMQKCSAILRVDLSALANHDSPMEVLSDYGPSYLYNLPLAKRKLFDCSTVQLFHSGANGGDRDAAVELVDLIQTVNEDFSILDAELSAFKGFQFFIQLISGHPTISKALCPVSIFPGLIRQVANAMVGEEMVMQHGLDESGSPSRLHCLTDLLVHLIHQSNRVGSKNDYNSIIGTLSIALERLMRISQFIAPGTVVTHPGDLHTASQYAILSNVFSALLLMLSHISDGAKDQEVLVKLIPIACVASSCQELQHISLMLLGILVREYKNTECLIGYLKRFEMVSHIIDIFLQHRTSIPNLELSEAAIHVLLSFVSNPAVAMEVQKENIMFYVCDTTQPILQDTGEPYVNKQRNIRHTIWCEVIKTVTHISIAIPNNPLFHEQLLRFIIIHEQRLLHTCQTLIQSPTFTIGQLKEVESIMALFDRWIHQPNRISHGKLFHIIQCVVAVLQSCVLTLLKPGSVHSQPKTEKEQKEAKIDPDLSSTSKSVVPIRFSVDHAHWKDAGKVSSPFERRVDALVHSIISYCLSFLQEASPKVWSFHFDSSNVFCLFSPALEPSTPQARPCLGILLYYALLVSQIVEREDGPPKEVLLFSFENAIALLLQQISLYPYNPSENRLDVFPLKKNLEMLAEKLPAEYQTGSNSLRSFVDYAVAIVSSIAKDQ